VKAKPDHRRVVGIAAGLVLAGTISALIALPPARGAERHNSAETGPCAPPASPVKADELEAAITRGADFLLAKQNQDGSWGSAQNTKGLNIYAPVPGAHRAFHTAVTAMCVAALLESAGDRNDARLAVDQGEAWLVENVPKLRRADATALYNNWGHAYAIHALVRLLALKPEDQARRERLKAILESQIEILQRYECVDGGWCYYDLEVGTKRPAGSSISFVSATVLVALYEAKQAGIEVPPKPVQRAVASIQRQRKPDFSYLYGEYFKYHPMEPINRPAGSLGRSQACNVALRLWGDPLVTDTILCTWLDRLFARNGWLDVGRKRPIPHESFAQVAGYFFYYGHYYAARCLEQLPQDRRSGYQDHLAHVLLPLQEKDGSWWDFPLYDYHQQYGTAFALMSLARCRK
jgi:hypothetical protein